MDKRSSALLTAVAIIAAGGAGAYASAPAAAETNIQQRRPPARDIGLSLGIDGLRAVAMSSGHTTPLGFGARMENAVQLVSATTGSRPIADSVNRNCGAGPTRIVRWSNGLQLLGQGGGFQGWEIERPGLGTMDGIEVGTSRARLNQQAPRIRQTSLGTEFTIGEGETALGGLLSSRGARGRVTVLWAGLTCRMT